MADQRIYIKIGRVWQETDLDLNSALYMVNGNYRVKVVEDDGTVEIY